MAALLNDKGNVCGNLNMKSAITENLLLAIPIENLIKIKNAPNPVTMDNWLTIGKLNSAIWKTKMGADWRQRAGRISVKKKVLVLEGAHYVYTRKKYLKFPMKLRLM